MSAAPKPRAASEAAADMAMLPHEYRVMFELEEEYWWYRGMRLLVGELLQRYAAPGGQSKILDVGCGTGKNLELFLERGDAYGIDIAYQAIEFCRGRGIPADRAFVASLLDLPFPDAFFDLAFSFDVICNVQDDGAAFEAVRRVLRPGGRLIVQLPAYRFLWSAHDVAVAHKRRYTASELRAKMTRAGFQIDQLTYLNMALFPLVALLRLARRSEVSNGRTRSDLSRLPRPLNQALTQLFGAEMRLAARVGLPYGVSLLAVARRTE